MKRKKGGEVVRVRVEGEEATRARAESGSKACRTRGGRERVKGWSWRCIHHQPLVGEEARVERQQE